MLVTNGHFTPRTIAGGVRQRSGIHIPYQIIIRWCKLKLLTWAASASRCWLSCCRLRCSMSSPSQRRSSRELVISLSLKKGSLCFTPFVSRHAKRRRQTVDVPVHAHVKARPATLFTIYCIRYMHKTLRKSFNFIFYKLLQRQDRSQKVNLIAEETGILARRRVASAFGFCRLEQLDVCEW